jgi:hypothetical protein
MLLSELLDIAGSRIRVELPAVRAAHGVTTLGRRRLRSVLRRLGRAIIKPLSKMALWYGTSKRRL